MKRHRFASPKATLQERRLNKLVAKIEREERDESVTPEVLSQHKNQLRLSRFSLFHNHKEA
jgi:hypothetical protein